MFDFALPLKCCRSLIVLYSSNCVAKKRRRGKSQRQLSISKVQPFGEGDSNLALSRETHHTKERDACVLDFECRVLGYKQRCLPRVSRFNQTNYLRASSKCPATVS